MKLLNFAFHACILSREFIIKFGYNARSHWLKERAYQSIGAELKLSRHLPNCTMSHDFPDSTLKVFYVT